jgi:hypothetical protein
VKGSGVGVGVIAGEFGTGAPGGGAVGSGDVEMSALDEAAGTGGGGGVPGAGCANETELVPNAIKATAANAIVRRFKSTPMSLSGLCPTGDDGRLGLRPNAKDRRSRSTRR